MEEKTRSKGQNSFGPLAKEPVKKKLADPRFLDHGFLVQNSCSLLNRVNGTVRTGSSGWICPICGLVHDFLRQSSVQRSIFR